MKKLLKAIAGTMALAIMLVGCGNGGGNTDNSGTSQGGSSQGVKKYSLGSGASGGNFYLVGGGIATTLNKLLPEDFLWTAETTGGSTANLTMLQNGDAELGIAMASAVNEGMLGEQEWTHGVKHDKVRIAMNLYPSWLTIYTKKDSGINSLNDLNGRIVGLGSKGMAMDSLFRRYFDEHGIVPKQIHNDAHGATATALGDGSIEAAILFSYPPFPSIAELESTTELNFIGLKPEEAKWFLDNYSTYHEAPLPANSYKGNKEDVPSIVEWNLLATSSDVPEEDIYKVVKSLCENNKDMVAIHPSLVNMTAENILESDSYLHAGTIRYLKELGLDVPEKLIPPEAK